MAENKEKKGLKSLDMADLVNYEKATRLLCIKYENSFKGYDGSMRDNLSTTLQLVLGYIGSEIVSS